MAKTSALRTWLRQERAADFALLLSTPKPRPAGRYVGRWGGTHWFEWTAEDERARYRWAIGADGTPATGWLRGSSL